MVVVLLFVGTALLALPHIIKKKDKSARCTEVIRATVLGFEEGEDPENPGKILLYPVLDYSYNARHFKFRSGIGRETAICMTGDEIPLDIDPDHPSNHCFATYLGDRTPGFDVKVQTACSLAGLAFLALGMIAMGKGWW